MFKWYDKRENFYDFDTGTLYPETIFGMASFLLTPTGILIDIDDPFSIFFIFAIISGVIGIGIAIANIVRAVSYGRHDGITFSIFGIAASLLGIAIAIVAIVMFGF